MKLMEVTRLIHALAEVKMEEPGMLVPPDLAQAGYDYFLEIDIARDVVPALPHVDPHSLWNSGEFG